MDVVLRLSFREHGMVRLLNWLAGENAEIYLARPDLPPLYRAGVVYQRETIETWCDVLATYAQAWEDCDGLAACRAGELIARGWRAIEPGYASYAAAQRLRPTSVPAYVFLRSRTEPEHAGMYHCLVRYRVGNVWYEDDPSARLGMVNGRFLSPADVEARLARQRAELETAPATAGALPEVHMSLRRVRTLSERYPEVSGPRGPRPHGPHRPGPHGGPRGGPRRPYQRDNEIGWGSTDLNENVRMQARPGYRAASVEIKPGLWVVGEVPEASLGDEVGFLPLLAVALVRAAQKGLAKSAAPAPGGGALLPVAPRPPLPALEEYDEADAVWAGERPRRAGPRRLPRRELPEWAGEIAAEIGCSACGGGCGGGR